MVRAFLFLRETFFLLTCYDTCYIGGSNCILGMFGLFATKELVAKRDLGQAVMAGAPENFVEMVKDVPQQLGLSQEALTHDLGVIFAIIKRWENTKTVPFKLARTQFEVFCEWIKELGKLKYA